MTARVAMYRHERTSMTMNGIDRESVSAMDGMYEMNGSSGRRLDILGRR